MDIDGQDGDVAESAELAGEIDSFDEEVGGLTLDGDGDGDGDGDADSEDEDELECMGKLLESALQDLVQNLSPQDRNTIVEVIAQFALPSNPLPGSNPNNILKAFYYLLVTRNKTTGVPLYSTSAIYNANPQYQAQIQQSITGWDAIPDNPDRWNDLAEGIDNGSINTEALQLDLILSFQFTRLVTNALHQANDQFANKWTPAGMAAQVGVLVAAAQAAGWEGQEALSNWAKAMAIFQVPSLGYPPFAIGAQTVLIAYTVLKGLVTAQQIQECLEKG